MRKKYRKRRNWSDDEKRMICAQTRVRGVSVSQVARRYDVNANQVFNWLKEPRFADAAPLETEQDFLPVEIVEGGSVSAPVDGADCGVLEIDLAGGHRLRIKGAYDASGGLLRYPRSHRRPQNHSDRRTAPLALRCFRSVTDTRIMPPKRVHRTVTSQHYYGLFMHET